MYKTILQIHHRAIKTLTLLFSLFFIYNAVWAQNPNTYREKQRAALKLIHNDPAKAKKELDRLLADSSKVHDSIFDYTYKLLGMYHWSAHNLDSATYFYKKAIAINHWRPERQAGIFVNLSAVSAESGDLKASYDQLQQALHLYDSIGDIAVMGNVYINLGNIYSYTDAHDEAIEALLKATEALKIDSVKYAKNIALANFNIANSYARLKDYDFALRVYDDCIPIIKELFGPRHYYIVLLGKAYVLAHLDREEEALELAQEAIMSFKQTEEFHYLLGYAYMHKAIAHAGLRQYIQAERAFDDAFNYGLKESDDLLLITIEYLNYLNQRKNFTKANEVIIQFEEIDRSYSAQGMADWLAYYKAKLVTQTELNNQAQQLDALRQITKLQDSLNSGYNLLVTQELHQKYKADLLLKEEQLNEAQIELLEKKNAEKRLWIIVSFLLLLIATGVGVYQWYTKSLKNKLAKSELDRINEQNKSLEVEAKMQEENVKLKEAVIEKQKQELITSSIEVNSLRQKMEDILSNSKKSSDLGILKKSIAALAKDQTFTQRLLDKFKSIDPDFVNKLAKDYPELTNNELEFCALLRLGLHNKEIAHILQISHESVIKKRYRLSKKLKKNVTEDINLDAVLREMN